MSSNFIKSFSRFTYSQFFRFKGQPGVNQRCGGVLSILIFFAMGIILITQMIKVFQKETLTFTSHIQMSSQPPMTTISTYQNDKKYMPFMFAIDLQGANPGKNVSSIKIKACISKVQGPFSDTKREQNYDLIDLEKCTSNHFSVLDNAKSKLSQWGSKNWLCLPLNSTYTIGGSFTLSNLFQAVNILFNCSGECMKKFDGLNVWLYTLSSFINPTSSKKPAEYYFTETTFPIEFQKQNEYSYDLQQNIIITDNSILPFKNEERIRSIIAGQFKQTHHLRSKNFSSTLMYFQRSGKSTTYYRSYYKIMDALSFVGGTYNSIFLLFFFMGGFMAFFFQMKFAGYYFKNTITTKFYFFTYLQQILDSFLSLFNCRVANWQEIESRHQIKKTVNNLLDVVYLQKRIEFLQKAISVLFKQHQLKGLHLIDRNTKQVSDQNYKEYQFRERIDYYFTTSGDFIEDRIEEIKEKDFDEIGLKKQLQNQVKKFIQEAKEKKQSLSYKIYSRIDQQIKSQLQSYLNLNLGGEQIQVAKNIT